MIKPQIRRPLISLLILSQVTLAASPAPRGSSPLDLQLPGTQGYLNGALTPSADLGERRHDIDLPEIGDPSGTIITPLQEKELGEAFFRNLHNEVSVNEDPEIGDYIQTIGQKLAANSDNPSQVFRFFVVTDPTINAFAGPGGFIGVNSGLILTSEAESELASVLAHEIAHVTQRHLYQAFQAASRLSLPTAAAMLAAVLLGAKAGSGQLGQAAIMAAQAANIQYQINFTRDNEAEADRVGMQTLSRSEFDPRAMPTFFERMQQSTRFAGRDLPEFLLTHPVTVSRISDTRGRAETFPYRQYPDSFTYQLVRAKLRVQTAATPQQAIDYFKAIGNQGTRQQQDVARYGLAQALVAALKLNEGKQILQKLVLQYPEQSHFINALAYAEVETRNYSEALRLYLAAMERFPGNRAVRLNYTKALLLTGKAREARALLEDLVHEPSPSPEIFNLMGQSYSALGQEAQSHRYVAEAYYAGGQTRAAILQLKIARKLAGNDFYVNAVIDERLKQFIAEEEERRKR
ncbi:MAG: uncharacterized protein H6R26_537 [Proteobacteria bacterium]|nr:uncharacterized protein [Pseudomonadota bacterium]